MTKKNILINRMKTRQETSTIGIKAIDPSPLKLSAYTAGNILFMKL